MKLRNFFAQPQRGELDEELRSHFEHLVEENITRGMSPEDARRQAQVEFGNMEKAVEQTSGQYPGWWLETVAQDIRYGLRGLRRSLLFAVTAVITLALGIGATTAVFSVVDRILFRSLPYADGDRLVSVGLVAPIVPQEFMLGSGYYVWKKNQKPFESLSSWTGSNLCDLSEINPLHLTCANVESDLLPTLGISLLRGRNFRSDEDVPNAPRVAIISYGLWKKRFGMADDVLGKTISIDGETTRIIGILPPEFELPSLEHADIVLPQRLDEAVQRRSNPGRVMFGVARLKPGLSIPQAIAKLQPLFQQALDSAPPRFRKEVHLRVRSLRDFQVHDAKLTAWVLLGAVFAVFLICSANVSSLLLARAADRQAEFAIRRSLGASSARLLSQMLTEALLLSILGVIAGWLLGELLLRIFLAMAPPEIPYITHAQLDLRVLLFAVLMALIGGIVFGSAPFWTRDMLVKSASPVSTQHHRPRARQILIVAQVCFTVMLVATAGLMLRTVSNLQNQSLGIDTNQLVLATVHFGRQGYANNVKKVQFVDELEERLKHMTGVNAVSISDTVPPGGLQHDQIFGAIAVEGRPKPEGGTGGRVAWRWVTPSYFRTLGVRISRGPGFTEEERQSNDNFIVLSEALAARLFPNEDPIGKRIAPGSSTWYTVVGLAANAKNEGLSEESEPEYYRLWRNRPEDWVAQWVANFVLSTPDNPPALESMIRSEIANIDRTVPAEFQTMHQRVASFAERPRFEASLLSFFAGLGLALAAIGLYGVLAFIVSNRTQEIAVRIALGADKRDIMGLIGVNAMKMIGFGLLLGVIGALSVSRAFRALLFGVTATDSITLLSAIALLLLAAAAAIWVPLQRAMRVDPMRALRYE